MAPRDLRRSQDDIDPLGRIPADDGVRQGEIESLAGGGALENVKAGGMGMVHGSVLLS